MKYEDVTVKRSLIKLKNEENCKNTQDKEYENKIVKING